MADEELGEPCRVCDGGDYMISARYEPNRKRLHKKGCPGDSNMADKCPHCGGTRECPKVDPSEDNYDGQKCYHRFHTRNVRVSDLLEQTRALLRMTQEEASAQRIEIDFANRILENAAGWEKKIPEFAGMYRLLCAAIYVPHDQEKWWASLSEEGRQEILEHAKSLPRPQQMPDLEDPDVLLKEARDAYENGTWGNSLRIRINAYLKARNI
jgi:hypothetical protein